MLKTSLTKNQYLNKNIDKFNLGDLVYCHAKAESIICLTRSILVRLPTKESKVNKVIVLDVYALDLSILLTARSLLGKRIPISIGSLSIKPSDWIFKSYKYESSVNKRDAIIAFQRKKIERENNGGR